MIDVAISKTAGCVDQQIVAYETADPATHRSDIINFLAGADEISGKAIGAVALRDARPRHLSGAADIGAIDIGFDTDHQSIELHIVTDLTASDKTARIVVEREILARNQRQGSRGRQSCFSRAVGSESAAGIDANIEASP